MFIIMPLWLVLNFVIEILGMVLDLKDLGLIQLLFLKIIFLRQKRV